MGASETSRSVTVEFEEREYLIPVGVADAIRKRLQDSDAEVYGLLIDVLRRAGEGDDVVVPLEGKAAEVTYEVTKTMTPPYGFLANPFDELQEALRARFS